MLDPERCAACGGPTHDEVSETDAFVRHGGYGATRRQVCRCCRACGWNLLAEVTEVRPPR